MYQKLSDIVKRNRYKLAIFSLLTGASIISIFLVVARVAISDSFRYTGLVWNLFLAWIPFVLAYIAYAFSWRRIWLLLLLPFAAMIWLLFFPNAPYILTDLQHLALQSSTAPLWYDVITLIWFSWTGTLLGVISLFLMHDIVQRTFGRVTGWLFVFVVSGLSSLGVYLGRFVRFNSWDILDDPTEIAMTILGLVIDPSLRLAAFLLLYTVFFLFVYVTLYAFGHLLQEHANHARE
jgi:uncharacterized membrane protein